ncbi:MAG TPA: hypothetical protein VI382_02160 [Candidatus Manganitrophaceae bacterium]|nr:hypothetical protein [Candidatus Manganitrophaceae bacterium]
MEWGIHPTKDLDPEQWMRIGEAHFRAGLLKKERRYFKDAVYAFNRAKKMGVQTADLYCWLARSYGYLALHVNLLSRIFYAFISLRFVRRALKRDGNHAFSYYVLGMWFQQAPSWAGGDPEKVLRNLDKAVELQSDRIIFRIARARWFLNRNMKEPALQECRRIIEAPSVEPEDGRRKGEANDILERYTTEIEARRGLKPVG